MDGNEIQRNFVCFISRLPVETLEAIFMYGACDYYSKDDGHAIPTAPSWVNVSYICRHWRYITLNSPALWSNLFIASPRWTEELLARSKPAPLKLYVNLQRQDEKRGGPCFLKQVMSHLGRIQELHLHLTALHDSYQFLSKLSSPAPRLQILEITMDSCPSKWSSVPFDGETPALRTLRLWDCLVPWHSLKLSRLTTLSLSYVRVRFQNTVYFWATLSCMQDLAYLYLEDAFASAPDFLSSTTFNPFQKFNLPRLSRLLISAPLSTVIAFLSCVNMPLQTEVRIIFPEFDPPLGDYTPISSLLAQRCSMYEEHEALSSPTIRSLVVASSKRASSKKVAKLTFSTSERDCDSFLSPFCMEWGRNIPLQIHLDFGHSSISDRDCLMSHMCCPLPWSNVQTIHFLDPPFSSSFWMHVLGHLQDLRYIKLSKGYMPDLASLLSFTPRDCTENPPDRDPNRIFAPALEELELYDTVFSSALKGDMDPLKVAYVQLLCDALATRKETQGRLTMTRCTVRHTDGEEKQFDVKGRWEGSGFHVVVV